MAKTKPLSQVQPRTAFARGVRHGVQLSEQAMQFRAAGHAAALEDVFRVGRMMANVCYAAGNDQMRFDAGDKQMMEALDRQWRLAERDYHRRVKPKE